MSNSRSITPTPNRPSTNPSAAASTTDSKSTIQPLFDDINKARISIEEDPRSPMRSFVHDPHLHSPVHRGVTRPAGGELTPPKSKRPRLSSIEPPKPATGPESPSSDSGMADSEGDVTPGRGEDVASNAGPQPKKKRTRTLTTPHQAAVLHALLEKSRFPTTAVREEVGRSIGLSARKVQVCFQNQRQKARKSTQSRVNVSKSHPPQYGPYPPVASPVASAPYSSVGPPQGHGSYTFHPSPSNPASAPGPSSRPHRSHSASLLEGANDGEVSPRLLGPGMPGALLYPRRPLRTRDDEWPASAPPIQQRFPSASRLPRYHSPPPSDSYPMLRPSTSYPRPRFERDPSRTLPPLVRTRPSTTSSLAMKRPLHWDNAPHLIQASLERERSISPETRFAHHAPERSRHSPMILPPPFALQPAPQWEDSADAILSRPSSSWSHPEARLLDKPPSSPPSSTNHDIILPPMGGGASGALRHGLSGGDVLRILPESPTPHGHSPSRLGRYDPVREMFIPFSRPLTPASRSPSQSREVVTPSEAKA
ncbi:hypothetical protein BKA70DRAFT_1192381 [Coprinopsis sp. MPI-PUGE-AT-0042]|nr:hypothetical protein BKA70DRAFT_1192381 [Coprinopsis sp. MPI-PUGE-AT-0042]